jgi:hypothetical protein
MLGHWQGFELGLNGLFVVVFGDVAIPVRERYFIINIVVFEDYFLLCWLEIDGYFGWLYFWRKKALSVGCYSVSVIPA